MSYRYYWQRTAEVLRLSADLFRADWWSDTLIQAFAISLAFHILVFGFVEMGHQLGWWRATTVGLLSRSRLRLQTPARSAVAPSQKPPRNATLEPPLLFVDVSPNQATAEPPKQAKYYSSVNSQAANPKPSDDTSAPRIDGSQAQVIKTQTTTRPEAAIPKPPPPPPTPAPSATKPDTLQPVLTPNSLPKPDSATAKPNPELAKNSSAATPELKPGNTVMAEPHPTPAGASASPKANPLGPGSQPRSTRPTTLAQAMQRQGLVAGQQMKQEGGVRRHALESSLDVRATPFGQYDAMFIAAVQKHWFDLLDERDYVQGRSGKVVLRFNLYYDGRVTGMSVADNTVGELLGLICQRAVLDPAPFSPWPSDLRRLSKSNFREVQFTFFYN